MQFCPECGEGLEANAEKCPRCGVNPNRQNGGQEKASLDSQAGMSEKNETVEQRVADGATGNLEESVEAIFRERGYQTSRGQKIKGRSGLYSEIGVMARRTGATLAIDCKNYAKDRKVGAEEIREFIAKLDNLDIARGLVVTTSDFSREASEVANNSRGSKQVDLWNGSDFMDQYQEVMLGRSRGDGQIIESCLAPRGVLGDYTALSLENKDRVRVAKREMIFHPYFIVDFNLDEQFDSPDRQTHSIQNSGRYYIDGVSEEVLFRSADNGNAAYDPDDAEKQIVKDLMALKPTTVKLPSEPDGKISKLEPSISNADVEFRIKTMIVNENKKTIKYDAKACGDAADGNTYSHFPHVNSVTTKSQVVYVPKIEIEFESSGRSYSRLVLPASGTVLRDDIAFCPHKMSLQKARTYAVCEACGMAKCKKDIVIGDNGAFYCKDHAHGKTDRPGKGGTVAGRFGRFGFRK